MWNVGTIFIWSQMESSYVYFHHWSCIAYNTHINAVHRFYFSFYFSIRNRRYFVRVLKNAYICVSYSCTAATNSKNGETGADIRRNWLLGLVVHISFILRNSTYLSCGWFYSMPYIYAHNVLCSLHHSNGIRCTSVWLKLNFLLCCCCCCFGSSFWRDSNVFLTANEAPPRSPLFRCDIHMKCEWR